MKLSLNFLVRIAGMLILAYLGASIGFALAGPTVDNTELLATRLLMLAGAGLGLLVSPRLTIEPLEQLLRRTREVPLTEIFLIGFGVLCGLIFSVLLAVPLAFLPPPFSYYLPLLVAVLMAYIGAMIFHVRRRELSEIVRQWRKPATALVRDTGEDGSGEAHAPSARRMLLDTSAIIDGRIAAVAETGFLEGILMVPSFVLNELQSLADSSDDLRRSKGRRGLELLNKMQKESSVPIEILSSDPASSNRVDDKLVIVARQHHWPVITNDFNLNRVARLQGVKVLSLNQLSEAVRPPVVPDQHLTLLIRNEGNSRQQGVGYLDDGTPVIVEEARALIGQSVEVIVTRLHQTQSGRLVFATLNTPVAEVDPMSEQLNPVNE
jgi:uncharacterized protein YacL